MILDQFCSECGRYFYCGKETNNFEVFLNFLCIFYLKAILISSDMYKVYNKLRDWIEEFPELK